MCTRRGKDVTAIKNKVWASRNQGFGMARPKCESTYRFALVLLSVLCLFWSPTQVTYEVRHRLLLCYFDSGAAWCVPEYVPGLLRTPDD